MAEKPVPRVDGPRNAAHILREISVMVEQHGIDMPRVQFGCYDGDSVSYYIHGATDYGLPYTDTEGRAASKRLDMENQFNRLTELWDAVDGPLEWVSNDPSEPDQKEYFRLAALYRGCKIELWCSRSDIGEFVEQIESGPQLTRRDGEVQLVRQQITVWKPNISIGRRAVPQYELAARPLVLALTEQDPF